MDLTGKVLISPPNLKSSFWYKSVIYLTEHTLNGSVGLVLNKKSPVSIREFGNQIGIPLNIPGSIYIGGPVQVKSLNVLHTSEWCCSNTMFINDEFSISSSEDLLNRISQGDTPKRFRMFLGVCGWAPNQLNDELKGTPPRDRNLSWLTSTVDRDLIFDIDSNEQWQIFLERSADEFVQSILV